MGFSTREGKKNIAAVIFYATRTTLFGMCIGNKNENSHSPDQGDMSG